MEGLALESFRGSARSAKPQKRKWSVPRSQNFDGEGVALSDQSVEAVAQKVVELLLRSEFGGEGAPAPLLTPSELARHLGRTREWVYEHADELGAARVGEGPKPRLLFDPRVVNERLRLKQAPALKRLPLSPTPDPQRPPSAMPVTATELLPIGPATRRSRR